MPDLTTTAGAVSGPGRVRDGRHQARRRRRAHGLRLVHHHRAAAPRGPRLLRQGRGRRRSSTDGKLGPGGALPDEHERRRPLLHPPRAVRHVPARRGGAPAARRVRRTAGPGAEIAVAHGSRRRAVGDGHRRARHGGDPDERADASREDHRTAGLDRAAEPFWDATREQRASCCRGASTCDAADLVPARRVPALPRSATRVARGQRATASCTPSSVAAPAQDPGRDAWRSAVRRRADRPRRRACA